MKSLFLPVVLSLTISLSSFLEISAQNNDIVQHVNAPTIFLVEKQNGAKFRGEIISDDAREILIRTKERGDIYIPQHEIKQITEILDTGDKAYVSEDIFATRYFITTNGLPIKKGENYIQWNLYGPDFQFGIADNFGVGVMTSWLAIPVIANAKYSIQLSENNSLALGALLGTGSWAMPEFGLALPFASLTFGNRRNNLTFSTGYGLLFYQENEYNPEDYYNAKKINRREGRFLFSIAGMAKLTEQFSLVFDTFIAPWGPEKTRTEWDYQENFNENTGQYYTTQTKREITEKSPNLALILPGIRWHIDSDKAFQFGFSGFYFDNEFLQLPIPMVQFYRRL